jgi:L-cysteine S-thiosulfotransferase
MRRHSVIAVASVFAVSLAHAQQRTLPLDALRSGIEFAGSDVRSMQSDDVANPGFLWIERGEKLWREGGNGKSCNDCHGDASASMRGVAARYPAYDASSSATLDLDARIND